MRRADHRLGLRAEEAHSLRRTGRPLQISHRLKVDDPDDQSDLIIATEKSSIATLGERTTSRHTMLLHLLLMDAFGTGSTFKNLPAVRDATLAQSGTLPGHVRPSVAWDQGSEMAKHAQVRIGAGIAVYFADRYWPSWRPGNEKTNGLLGRRSKRQ